MAQEEIDILILDRKIEAEELRRLAKAYFDDMVKIVVDVRRRVVGVGGELHADAEQLLLESGSRQADIWGANYYPGRGSDSCIEYTALINIRPSEGSRGMEIADESLRRAIREITFELVGSGDEEA